MAVRAGVSLSPLELDFVWEHLGLGEAPYPLEIVSHGHTMGERAELRDQVLTGLVGRRLYDGRDLDPDLEELLILLVRNSFTIDAQLALGGHVRALAASRDDSGVLAVLTGEGLRLDPIRGSGIVHAVVALLPDLKPGPGVPVSLPKSVFSRAVDAFERNGYVEFEAELNAGGVTGRDMRTITTLVESRRHGGGQFAVNTVDQMGRRTRSEVLNWFDTDNGRYMIQSSRSAGQEPWLTFSPSDAERLASRLHSMLGSV
ncbi:ESAT-6 protein secretion system EspG family protein [Herbihabitans rhizosphaerae]|uniref:ESAT-6 protein secretion system EspG family protein n=1 Tax=Herbihabitans rhizosphaerae TaxID=1872711 RepID=A0A4Q7L9F8_9PSEU|nr:ESX secretion-associated protein EspG [Herbihabitans rhizosphaerae]RZS45072.1 ESAT-6 protein secretion system EspG family protein [Herbihabitans rhizosphaerae]